VPVGPRSVIATNVLLLSVAYGRRPLRGGLPLVVVVLIAGAVYLTMHAALAILRSRATR
jgi:hypothetical protein